MFSTACSTNPCFLRPRSTGKERDQESGNDYFGARYYASTMGRFMSPDWSAKPEAVPYSDLTDPQSLNLYTYVKNNPLSHFDKDGHVLTPIEIRDSQGNIRITYIDTRLVGRLQNFVNNAAQQGVTFTFNNVFRSESEQNALSTNYTHNTTGTSPHEAGVAFDINVNTSLKGTDLKGLTKIAGESGSKFSPLANQAADPPHFQANDLITRGADGKVDQKYKDLIKENQNSYQQLEQQRRDDPQEFDKKLVPIQQ